MKKNVNAEHKPIFCLKRIFVVIVVATLFASAFAVSIAAFTASAETTSNILNFYVVAKPDFSGQGYDAFSPQTLVAQQGDQVNLTIRNTGNQTFRLQMQSQPAVTIQPGTQNGTQITPTDTSVPIFTASNSGIFDFSTAEHPEMKGQLVVLPSDWASYSPAVQTRSFTQLIFPDFAGDGYDKYFPAVIVVNQGDTLNLTIRNTDDMTHGFAIAAYSIDAMANPGQDLPDGSIAPVDTQVAPFVASAPGIFRFLCTVYCGRGHFEMIGFLVVLPTQGTSYRPMPVTMYSYLTIKPDFAGDGYDKYLPGVVFANMNDLIYIKVRNTDTVAHGFGLPYFGLSNESIAPATVNSTGNVQPMDTYLPPFLASQAGIFEFFCTDNCGVGHDQMTGYLVVLPTQTAITPSSSPPPSSPAPISSVIFVGLAAALLTAGILIGVVIVQKFTKEESPTA